VELLSIHRSQSQRSLRLRKKIEALRNTTRSLRPWHQTPGFKQIIDMTAAKALGLTIPPSLLVAANEVIE
jgi:hypothetical protein